MSRRPLDVLEYWWILELFGPQKVPKVTGRAKRPEDRQVVEWRVGEALPWQVLPPPRPVGRTPRVWRHTVYLGVYDLEATYQRLHAAFAEDRDAYDERRAGLSACAAVLVDASGVLVSESAVMSSALWAVSKLAAGTPPRGTRWASGFAEASAGMLEEFDALDGARREAAGQELPPAQDGASVQRLLAAAHAAAGVTGDDDLATQRVVIQSVAVSARFDEDAAADLDFLNSFFLEDLAAVHEDVAAHGPVGALADYLTSDTDVRADARVDVMTDHQVVDQGVSIRRLPKGRWPAEPDHGLALRQQLAVNQALLDLSEGDGLMGVNGPPGTGKTTMLRDILAGNVVERASRLASLPRPADAFTPITHRWTAADGYPRRVRQLRGDLTGFEMVVASANNAAVENVSTEIPARAAIAEDWRAEADYFADIATAALRGAAKAGESSPAELDDALAAWGLVAARLGNKTNRGAFRSEFWFDKTNPRTKQRIPGTAPRMQSRLLQWRDGEVSTRSWSDARDAFQQAERRVDELIEARRAAEDRLARLGDALRSDDEAVKRAAELENERAITAEAARSHARDLARSDSAAVAARDDRSRHVETRPSALETLFSLGRAARAWRHALAPLDAAVQEAEQRRRTSQERANQLEDARMRLAAEFARNEETRAHLSAELATLRSHLAADRDRYGSVYPGEGWSGVDRELRAPWLDAEIDAARSDLFLAALQLHQDFLAATAGDMLEGLRAAIDVVAGTHPYRLEPEKVHAAWQLFFLVVPMVSTTFASFGRMFKGLGPESLGWVFIDEAGQACPQYAVGAIWRARRVIAVGDPLQLQPVVTIPARAARDIAAAFRVSDTWIPPRASVQTVADRVSPQGTQLRHGEETVWVSAPLTVHRRCDDPMFSLFNAIAYNGIMVSGVTRRPDLFDSPKGARIPASRWLDEAATTVGTHLQRNQIACLRRQIEALRDEGIAADDMIAISPFREVADHLAGLDRSYPGLRAGTIHTAQGREADVVFLVLGGDPTAAGARAWAAATVNLVNVAASRAKRRLYVIGDKSAWARHNYFHQLAAALAEHRHHR
ncbi:MAG: DEAD/DEAH box helicase [Propioniciclava sp.]